MEEKTAIDWKTEEEFRGNACYFYRKCKKEIRMPYSEEFFVETICAIFGVMQKGKKPNLGFFERNAINAIKVIHQEMPIEAIKTEVRKVISGKEVGNASYGRWFDLCCEFRRKAQRQYYSWNEYCKAIAEKEQEIISKNKKLTNNQKDIIHLVITIELL